MGDIKIRLANLIARETQHEMWKLKWTRKKLV
jgi:hypothetical protein